MKNLLLIILSCVFFGCQNPETPRNLAWVEISPNKWLEIEWSYKLPGMICEWNGKIIKEEYLMRNGDTEHLLKTLREKNGTLYSIQLDRSEPSKSVFIFKKLDADDTEFEEIKPEEFPREIATQNVQLDGLNDGIGNDGKIVDQTKILRELDVNNGYFAHQFTAELWASLETGKPYYQVMSDYSYEERQEIAKEYKKKYNPIPLKNLVRKK